MEPIRFAIAGTGYRAIRFLRAARELPEYFTVTAMLSRTDARAQEVDRVTGLMTGADDYVTKPFSPTELIARIDALYRRLGGVVAEDTSKKVSGPFELNTRNRTLDKNGVRVRLTQVEYTIMKYFLENPDRAISREDMLTAVWGNDGMSELKIVDVNIRRLRIKIEDNPADPTYIQTVWGYGYKWNS